jgi:hypothetical protein
MAQATDTWDRLCRPCAFAQGAGVAASHAKSVLLCAAAVRAAQATALVFSSPKDAVPLINRPSSCDRERRFMAGHWLTAIGGTRPVRVDRYQCHYVR